MSAWVRRLGSRVCISNGIAELRRSPRVNGDKGRQKKVNGPKDMGGNNGGVEHTGEDKPETEAEMLFRVERIGVVNTQKE